uniref:Uncharacterized protein n=1 Tax=Ananas comosus var. bracteatus TaxID=296719 RepID=A0A6V7P618_ANACO|nr:unnamed protein product [Ananas comosus var. bracteatus]
MDPPVDQPRKAKSDGPHSPDGAPLPSPAPTPLEASENVPKPRSPPSDLPPTADKAATWGPPVTAMPMESNPYVAPPPSTPRPRSLDGEEDWGCGKEDRGFVEKHVAAFEDGTQFCRCRHGENSPRNKSSSRRRL